MNFLLLTAAVCAKLDQKSVESPAAIESPVADNSQIDAQDSAPKDISDREDMPEEDIF
jgi:hypothetical protein